MAETVPPAIIRFLRPLFMGSNKGVRAANATRPGELPLVRLHGCQQSRDIIHYWN